MLRNALIITATALIAISCNDQREANLEKNDKKLDTHVDQLKENGTTKTNGVDESADESNGASDEADDGMEEEEPGILEKHGKDLDDELSRVKQKAVELKETTSDVLNKYRKKLQD